MNRCLLSNKIIYTKRDAEASRNLAHRHGKFFRIYQCPDCDFWHLTTKNPNQNPYKNKRRS